MEESECFCINYVGYVLIIWEDEKVCDFLKYNSHFDILNFKIVPQRKFKKTFCFYNKLQ